MFDDGYDTFCLNIVSMFERNPTKRKRDMDAYCGCVEHLESASAYAVSEEVDETVLQPAK